MFHYVNDKYAQLVFDSNEDVAAASSLTLHGKNNEDSEKKDKFTNIAFEAIVPSVNKLPSFVRVWLILRIN